MPPRLERRPAVSVLVPICNVERYLDECLASLASQTFGDFEAICINDGSTDASREIVQRYLDADPRFRVIDKPNSGYGASMNCGLDNATGSYVAILESDDLFAPGALALLHDAAEKNASDVVKANFWLYWSRPEERCELFKVVDDAQAGRTMCPLDDIAVFFRKPSIWSALYRRDFLAECGIRFLETPGASYQDSGFNFKVWASARSATFLAEPVLFYRQDNEKSSVNNPGKVFCVCDEYVEMERFLTNAPVRDAGRLLGVLERMKFDTYLWNFDRLDGELRERFVRRAAQEFSCALDEGKVERGLFEPGAWADLEALAASPTTFSADRERYVGKGTLASLLRYLRLGGLPLVVRVVWFRLFGNSVRRTDERGASL